MITMKLKRKLSVVALMSLVLIGVTYAVLTYYTHTFNDHVVKVGLDTFVCLPIVDNYQTKISTEDFSADHKILVSVLLDYGVDTMNIQFDVVAKYNGEVVEGLVYTISGYYCKVWTSTKPLASGQYIDLIEPVTLSSTEPSSVDINKMRYLYWVNQDGTPPANTNALQVTFTYDSFPVIGVPPDATIDLYVTVIITS